MEVSGQIHAPAALPRGKISGTHCIGDYMGPRAYLDVVKQRKIHFPCPESNPGRRACSPSLYRLSSPGLHLNEVQIDYE
jgi:hypothetical protein